MKGRPIVIIEDDLSIREGLQEFLEAEGYRVAAAENGRKGLEVIRAHQGDCFVLLDLQMPIMTGEQLLHELARDSDPALQKMPILVLTARAEGFRHERIVGFLRKPVDLDQLLSQVESHCS